MLSVEKSEHELMLRPGLIVLMVCYRPFEKLDSNALSRHCSGCNTLLRGRACPGTSFGCRGVSGGTEDVARHDHAVCVDEFAYVGLFPDSRFLGRDP